jgi:aspartate aminotransferase-like enzyme
MNGNAMTGSDFAALLDLPPFPAAGYAVLANRTAKLLNTSDDILLMQGEAILSLEAVATSIARADLRALNIVTSPYGAWFGAWLRRGGADVIDLTADAGKSIRLDAVKQAIETAERPFDLLALVHAESASGILNPLEEIAALAAAHRILTVVDAVASVGGHELDVDKSKLDIVVIGPQKALGGPAGISAISISQTAWDYFNHHAAPRLSILSIIDQKELWIDQGRGALPGTPSSLEFHAYQAALDRIDQEGFAALLDRHKTTSRAMRRAISAAGLKLWVDDQDSSSLVTTVVVPATINCADLMKRLASMPNHTIGEAIGPGTDQLIRINHTGPNAQLSVASANVRALAQAMHGLNCPFNEAAALAVLSEK